MKFFVFFVLCFVALTAAAPQFIATWPGLGYIAPALGSKTVIVGPTVVNGVPSPGYIGVY